MAIKEHSRIRQAVMTVLASLFGSRSNGFVDAKQAQAVNVPGVIQPHPERVGANVKASPRAKEIAEQIDSATAMGFHALIDIAKNCGKSGALNAFTVRETVGALVGPLASEIRGIRAKLRAPGVARELEKSLAALADLAAFVEQIDCSDNDEKTSVWHGRVIHAYTLDAARALERAQRAVVGCGSVVVGWLDSSMDWDAE